MSHISIDVFTDVGYCKIKVACVNATESDKDKSKKRKEARKYIMKKERSRSSFQHKIVDWRCTQEAMVQFE